MDQFIEQLVSFVASHQWLECFGVLAGFAVWALHNKSTWFPASLSLPWRVVLASGLTMAGVVVQQLASGLPLSTLAPWFATCLPVLVVEVLYALKGQLPPPDQQNLPPVLGAPTLSPVGGNGAITVAERPNLVVQAVRSFQLASAMIAVLGLSLVGGCAGPLETAKRDGMGARKAGIAPSGVNCESLDRGRLVWHGAGISFGALGGASGLTAVAVHSDGLKDGLAIGAVVAAGAALGAEAIAQGASSEWVKYCSGDVAIK